MTPTAQTARRLARCCASFMLSPQRGTALGAFRICFGVVLLTQAALVAGAVEDLYGAYGMVQWLIGEAIVPTWMPSVQWFAGGIRDYGIDHNGAVYLLFTAYVMAVVALTVGWYTRCAAVIAWFAHLTLTNTGSLTAYGVEAFSHIALFYCVVMPVGCAYSLDVHARRLRDQPTPQATLSLRVLQLHLCIVYLASGIEKARGIQWWTGEAIWRALMQPQFQTLDFSWLADAPGVAAVAAWGTLLVECGYAVFIWPRRTRGVWVLLTVGLHLGIGIFLGLGLFAFAMIALTGSVFGWELILAWWASSRLRQRAAPRADLRRVSPTSA